MQLDKIFLGLGLSKTMSELVMLLVVMLLLSLLFWVLIGRFRLHNFLINVYISSAMLMVVPKEAMQFSKYAPVILLLIFVVFLTLMNPYLFDIHQSGSGLALWQVLVMSFLEVGLVMSILLSFLPAKDVLKYLSKDALLYFSSPWGRVAWMVAPLAFLIFVNKRDR